MPWQHLNYILSVLSTEGKVMVLLTGVDSDSKSQHFPPDPHADERLSLLRRDVVAWNKWREENPHFTPSYWDADLSGADLRGADLRNIWLINVNLCGANLQGAALNRAILSGGDLDNANVKNADLENINLFQATLRGSELSEADLSSANLQEANLRSANLSDADLRDTNFVFADLTDARLEGADIYRASFADAVLVGADLRAARLIEANLARANLSGADLRGASLDRAILVDAVVTDADLRGAILAEANLVEANLGGVRLEKANLEVASLIRTNLCGARLDGCYVYGTSVWDVYLDANSSQRDLVVTPEEEGIIHIDNLKIAQLAYLLLQNENLRDVIDTVTRKAVLILGRFSPERKIVLDAIRDKLRELDYIPIVFDFEGSQRRDFRETVSTLAGLSRFVIVDVTNPSSSPLEMDTIIPDFVIPFVPIIQEGEEPFALFGTLQKQYSDRVLELLIYDNATRLTEKFESAILDPAIALEEKLLSKKAEPISTRRLEDYR